jgi:hypothetical protein
MKTLFLSVVVAAFAFAAQAGGEGCADKEGGACCAAKTQTKASAPANGECQMTKQTKSTTCPDAAKNSKKVATKATLKSPKASTDSRG